MVRRDKIKLATVFSGIGAIEQAFLRLKIPHEIVFACDNGDVLIDDIDYNDELSRIKKLPNYKDKNDYVRTLYKTKSNKTNFVEKTYLNNYKLKDERFFYDIKLFDGDDFKDKVDIYVGGSPCQSFSIAGARGGFEDTRGTLFYEYVRVLKEVSPNIFIYENVFGVLNHDHGKTWNTMQNVFNELGYHITYEVLDAKDYGIPQSRRRLFVVGFKNGESFKKFSFPKKTKLKLTMQDLLLDNCAEGNLITNKNGKLICLPGGQNVDNYLSDKLVKYVMSPGTKNFYHENAEINLPIARAILSTQGNTHRASVNNYVTTNGKIRALEPRESLRLMGFPDSFKITVSKAQSYKQSGNSIVVDVLMAILTEIMKAEYGTH